MEFSGFGGEVESALERRINNLGSVQGAEQVHKSVNLTVPNNQRQPQSGKENAMTTDRTTKVLLALIAMALFLNAIVPFVQPAVVQAQSGTIEIQLSQIFNELRQISTRTRN